MKHTSPPRPCPRAGKAPGSIKPRGFVQCPQHPSSTKAQAAAPPGSSTRTTRVPAHVYRSCIPRRPGLQTKPTTSAVVSHIASGRFPWVVGLSFHMFMSPRSVQFQGKRGRGVAGRRSCKIYDLARLF